jgi:hypothetical protein
MTQIEHELRKCKNAEDPNRCQGVGANGQCWLVKVTNSDYCMCHGGSNTIRREEKEETELYQIGVFKARLSRQKSHPELKTLNNEIAILRMTLEARLNVCETDTDLILAAPSLGDLVMKVDKVVQNCHKMEEKMGMHLDKSIILHFAGEVVTLIGKVVTDKDQIKRVAEGIMSIIGGMENGTSESPETNG